MEILDGLGVGDTVGGAGFGFTNALAAADPSAA